MLLCGTIHVNRFLLLLKELSVAVWYLILEIGGLFPFLRHHNRKQIIIFREECGYCCALPYDLNRDYKAINSYNPIQGATL